MDGVVKDFMLPDLGEGLTEAEILEWRVAVGDQVTVDQVVVVVETAKAAVDVPCPYPGTVVALHGEVGSILGKAGVNIANFALGRGKGGAVGAVKIDVPATEDGKIERAIEAIRAIPAVTSACLVKFS